MPEGRIQEGGCPFCWKDKHGCLRDPITKACRNCKAYVAKLQDGDNGLISHSNIHDAIAHFELFKTAAAGALASLDVNDNGLDSSIFGVQITRTFNHVSENLPLYSFHFGPVTSTLFNSRNKAFVVELDAMILKHLVPDLRGREDVSQAIHKAILASGCAHLLCSTIAAVKDEAHTIMDGIGVLNEYPESNLLLHFRYLVFSRLRELISEVMDLKIFDPGDEFPSYPAEAYAASVILWYELDYFRRQLRHGSLSTQQHLPNGFRDMLIKWFDSILQELTPYLRKNCGRFPNWQNSTIGSLKSSRRKGEMLSVSLTLSQTKYNISERLPPGAIFNQTGHGNHYLLPCPSPLQVPEMSIDVAGEIEQDPFHVSGPSSFDAWEETSDLVLRDLFPDLQPLDVFMEF